MIVAGIFEPLLPLGTLRRVQTIDRSGGAVVLTTVRASLAEAIERARIRQRIPLREENVQAVTAEGVVQEALGPTGLYFGLNDVVLFDGDGQPSPQDQVVLNGNIGIEPELDLAIDLDGFSLDEATVAIVGEISGNLNIDARREAVLPGQPMKLANLKLGAYVIPVGPIPVVISSDVDLLFGVDGKVTAKMNVGSGPPISKRTSGPTWTRRRIPGGASKPASREKPESTSRSSFLSSSTSRSKSSSGTPIRSGRA